ncbi:unnamed protein product [marine sediment metagenome]|uniref:Uncharacterized protein n=1 Tax=marine sediment metagenome TaxID=412755 RepID=X1EL24_9ZZZZ
MQARVPVENLQSDGNLELPYGIPAIDLRQPEPNVGIVDGIPPVLPELVIEELKIGGRCSGGGRLKGYSSDVKALEGRYRLQVPHLSEVPGAPV